MVWKYDTRMNDDGVLEAYKVGESEADSLCSPDKIAEALISAYGLDRATEEHFYVMAVDTKMSNAKCFEVAHGTISSCNFKAADVFKRAFAVNAYGVILSHNHPSGDAFPSDIDIKVTRDIKQLGDTLGIPLLDHIIIGGKTYYSFRKWGGL